MINWKVRFKNKTFWCTVIPALFLLAQTVLQAFGVAVDLTDKQASVMQVVDIVFTLLAASGVVIDHTTPGVGDSERALGYVEPGK